MSSRDPAPIPTLPDQVLNKEEKINVNLEEMKKHYQDPNFWIAVGLKNGLDRFQLGFFASLFVGSVIGSRTALETAKHHLIEQKIRDRDTVRRVYVRHITIETSKAVFRYTWRITALDILFTSVETTLHTYRRKSSAWHSMIAGTVTGLAFSPWLQTSSRSLSLTYGLGLGLFFGTVTAVSSSIRNVTQEAYNKRYFVRDIQEAEKRQKDVEKVINHDDSNLVGKEQTNQLNITQIIKDNNAAPTTTQTSQPPSK